MWYYARVKRKHRKTLEAEDRVQISGDADVDIFDSEFLDDVSLRLGRSANTVVVADSAFHKLDADGSSGNDVFADAGNNSRNAMSR